jgi:hypothetical protein
MEVINIELPAPDFDFSEVAIDFAKRVCDDLDDYQFLLFKETQFNDSKDLMYRLEDIYYKLGSNQEKLVYIKEILTFLINKELTISKDKRIQINSLQSRLYEIKLAKYFFYKQASSTGYNFDKNAFKNDEVYDISSKIDAIINALDEIKAGQEVLFDEFDTIRSEIKKDFESLKPDVVLGKNRFFKLALGSIGSYTGNKIADEIFAKLRPHIIALLVTQAPHLIEQVEKLLH